MKPANGARRYEVSLGVGLWKPREEYVVETDRGELHAIAAAVVRHERERSWEPLREVRVEDLTDKALRLRLPRRCVASSRYGLENAPWHTRPMCYSVRFSTDSAPAEYAVCTFRGEPAAVMIAAQSFASAWPTSELLDVDVDVVEEGDARWAEPPPGYLSDWMEWR